MKLKLLTVVDIPADATNVVGVPIYTDAGIPGIESFQLITSVMFLLSLLVIVYTCCCCYYYSCCCSRSLVPHFLTVAGIPATAGVPAVSART